MGSTGDDESIYTHVSPVFSEKQPRTSSKKSPSPEPPAVKFPKSKQPNAHQVPSMISTEMSSETDSIDHNPDYHSTIHFQDGSKEHPWLIRVDSKRPENNGIFFIQRIENMKITRDSTTRWVWEIKHVVQHPLDVDGCEATMPDPNKIPLPGGSAVLIKVPSVTHWFLNVDQFNEDSGEGCATTLDQRQSVIRDIEENGDRKSKYYMLLFPNGTSLDNSVFGHDNVVNMKHIPMADFLPTKGANNEELAVGMALQWNISEIGHRKTQAGLPSADVAAILAKKRADAVNSKNKKASE